MTGDDWLLEPVPWRELSRPVADPDEPLIGATWQGSPVAVVAPKVVEEWAAAAQAAFFPTADGAAQVVDVPATLEAEGVTGLLPPNALVIKNCAGIQLGDRNSQTNIHKFRVEDVRITLDKTLARTLAASLPPSASPVEGCTKVAIWNSRGVQIGDGNHQRNVFRHVVKGPEVPLGPVDRAVVDKLREGRLDAAERALHKMVRKVFEQDAAALYAALDVTCNENGPAPPAVLEDTITSAYGEGNKQKIREVIDVRALDLTDLLAALVTDEPRGALKKLPEEAVEEPAEPAVEEPAEEAVEEPAEEAVEEPAEPAVEEPAKPPEPELPAVKAPRPPAVEPPEPEGPFWSFR
ncbi:MULTISPECIES: RIP homotypic interaction motif-containing protein [unclassified Amycolatopsis]|uniref:RIP homotypic interaction motif-containing protein n=1 Tax=unclassified Amycolatopsis TaxID=2618356 RepID=UPI00287BC297|nr:MULTISPECIES: RIP homotypic interaction motif-containing protein [unclassified Amycolatopsis]